MAETIILFRQYGDTWVVLIDHTSATYQYALATAAGSLMHSRHEIRFSWRNRILQWENSSLPMDSAVTLTHEGRNRG